MGRLIDLTGRRFGRLLVLGRGKTVPRWHPSEGTKVYWRCQCDCGVAKEIYGQSLRRGHAVSCGCWRNEIGTERLKRWVEASTLYARSDARVVGASLRLLVGSGRLWSRDP